MTVTTEYLRQKVSIPCQVLVNGMMRTGLLSHDVYTVLVPRCTRFELSAEAKRASAIEVIDVGEGTTQQGTLQVFKNGMRMQPVYDFKVEDGTLVLAEELGDWNPTTMAWLAVHYQPAIHLL